MAREEQPPPLPELPEIDESEFEFRLPAWMVARARELEAEGKTPEEAAAIIAREAR